MIFFFHGGAIYICLFLVHIKQSTLTCASKRKNNQMHTFFLPGISTPFDYSDGRAFLAGSDGWTSSH
jgi:hypothetical protein